MCFARLPINSTYHYRSMLDIPLAKNFKILVLCLYTYLCTLYRESSVNASSDSVISDNTSFYKISQNSVNAKFHYIKTSVTQSSLEPVSLDAVLS